MLPPIFSFSSFSCVCVCVNNMVKRAGVVMHAYNSSSGRAKEINYRLQGLLGEFQDSLSYKVKMYIETNQNKNQPNKQTKSA